MTSLVDNGTYPIFEWTPTAAAILVTCGRFIIRWHYARSFRWDDAFCGLAMASLVAFVATNHTGAYNEDLVLALNAYLASDFLLWTTLYFVKASFLALMWSVFEVSTTFRRFWWAVSAYTFIAFLVCTISEIWTCGSPSDFGNFDICMAVFASETSLVSSTPDLLKVVFHISSDLLILALPLFQIRKLQMTSGKKMSVAAVFALTIIDIVTGILRNSSSICEDSPATWNSETCIGMNIITGIIEPSFAVAVCALPAYRAILPSSRKRRYESAELRRNAAKIGWDSPKRSQYPQRLEENQFPRPEIRMTRDYMGSANGSADAEERGMAF